MVVVLYAACVHSCPTPTIASPQQLEGGHRLARREPSTTAWASQLRGRWGKSSPGPFDEGWDTGRGGFTLGQEAPWVSLLLAFGFPFSSRPSEALSPSQGDPADQGTSPRCSRLCLSPYHTDHHQNHQNPPKSTTSLHPRREKKPRASH